MFVGSSRRSCVISKCTVDDKVVKVSPVNFLQELLNEAIFAGTTPDDCIVLVAKQEAYRHDCKVTCKDGRPSCATLMHFLAYQSEHGRYARPTYVHIQQSYFMLLRQQKRQLSGHCALPYSSLARKHEDLVLDRFQLVGNGCDGRINLKCSRGAEGLIGAALAS